MRHTILRAEGKDQVEGAVIAEVDDKFQPIPGTEKHLDVDTICLAVGLSPMSQVLRMSGCEIDDTPGGLVPKTDAYGETTIPGLFAAGDVAGIEEASSAMIGGRIAGLAAAHRAGYLDDAAFEAQAEAARASLTQLRQGMFARENRGRTDLTETEEGLCAQPKPARQGICHRGRAEGVPCGKRKAGRRASGDRMHAEHPLQPLPGCLQIRLHHGRPADHQHPPDRPREKVHGLRHVRGVLLGAGDFSGGR